MLTDHQRAQLLAILARGAFFPEARDHALRMLARDDRLRAAAATVCAR